MKELYGITEKDIGEIRSWEEGRVTIDIEKKTIDFNVMDKYSPIQFKSDYGEEGIKGMNVKEIDRDFNNISFEDVFDLKAFIDKANYNNQYYFYNKKTDEYILLIQ